MQIDDLRPSNSLVKSHTCAGKTERVFSERLGEKFNTYERILTNFFEVGDLSYVHVFKLQFGFLEQDSDIFNDLVAYFDSDLELESESITFRANFCKKDNTKFAVVTWVDTTGSVSYYPKYVVYMRKKDNLVI